MCRFSVQKVGLGLGLRRSRKTVLCQHIFSSLESGFVYFVLVWLSETAANLRKFANRFRDNLTVPSYVSLHDIG